MAAGPRLSAQTPASPAPSLEAADGASTAATPAPVPAKKKEKHGISISIGDDSAGLDEDGNPRLTQQQLYEIKLARAKNPTYSDLEDVLVPSGFFAMIVGIVWIVVWGRLRRNRQMHETARLFAEKGQPLPPEFFASSQCAPGRSNDVFAGAFPSKKPKSDLRRGIFWIAIGLGFFLAHHGIWRLGFIPLCIGLGYIVAWKLDSPSTPPNPGAGA